jgi:hypothetical protein
MNLTAAQLEIKRATQRAVEKAGGVVAVERASTMNRSSVTRYQSEAYPEIIPLDHALELDRAAGAPVVLKELAALAGFDLVSREERTELVENVNRIVGRLAKAGGELSQAVIEAAADNAFHPSEDRKVDSLIANVEDGLDDLKASKAALRVVR